VDQLPCVKVPRNGSLAQLPYRCPTVMEQAGSGLTKVPVFDSYTSTAPNQLDNLWKIKDPQYFRCQIQGATYHFTARDGLPDAATTWWAYTQGDNDWWGFVPEVYLAGAPDNVPDIGIDRTCTAGDLTKAGHRG
jgi:hypothetical protein